MTQDAAVTPSDGGTRGSVPAATDGSGPLEGLDDLPLGEHVARFEAVHDELRERLARGGA